jgi:hypothetical protein
MATDSQKRQLLRRAALSAAMLLIVAPAAFADPPGNLFRDFEHSAPVVASAPTLPRQVNVPNAESSLRAEQEKHACAVVLGLDRSEDPYATCIRSLERSLSESDQAQVVESNRLACAQEGLDPGTSAFATCVVKAEQSQSDARRYGAIVPRR